MPELPLPLRSGTRERKLAPASTSKMAALDKLPVELLELVTNNLDRPKDVLHLALTCCHLGNFVELYGWEAFLKGRFGLLRPHAYAKDTVHGLTTLYRNWDKKAFTARYLEPSANVISLNSGEKTKWRGPQGQTMGYQPSVDSYEETHGAWSDRREVLVWPAGTNVVMRVKETGRRAERVMYEQIELKDESDGVYEPGVYGHLHAWYTYKIPQSSEGRDDITALKLLRPHQKNGEVNIGDLQNHPTDMGRESDQSEIIVFGTASGRLSMLSADFEQRGASEQQYDTERRPVGSLSISSASEPLIAASLGDSSLALYSTNHDQSSETHIESLSQVQPIAPGMRVGRIWSSNFISNDRVAIGLGPSYEPIHVYEITPDGFTPEPLRKFDFDSRQPGVSLTDGNMRRNTSVYPVIPIPTESQGGSEANNVFLSGAYDGIVRLHDLRSPRGFETLFWDVTNDSSVYSLAIQGLERFIAGSSMHSMLKVFDLRFPGSHAYHSVPIPASTSKPKSQGRQDYTYNAIVNDVDKTIKSIVGGWNLFLSPRNSSRPSGGRHPYRPGPRTEDSPVYSLSIPSPTSSNLYAGLEGTVVNLNFVSVLDPHPDSLVTSFLDPGTLDSSSHALKQIYNPYDDILNLGMYEQGNEEGLGMQLLVQDEVDERLVGNEKRRKFARQRNLDERWKDPSEEGEKWVRGQVPQDNASHTSNTRRGGHRGRGRGRGRSGQRAG